MTKKAKTVRRAKSREPLAPLHSCAAGLDVGSTFHVVAVPPDRDPEPVRSFKSFTGDLHELADWLKKVGVTTIAMESTGVYWVPVFEILEARGFEVLLVNARDVKNVPGRKTDVNDAQWLQQLHEYGLLRASFRPRDGIARLRALLRHRDRVIEDAASHILRMQKSLMLMNVQLHHVVSDITGVTGMKIIRLILDGVRDPKVLSAHRDERCKESIATICKALNGNYRSEHVFTLRQAVQLYDFHQAKVAECDVEIEAAMGELNTSREPPSAPLPTRRHSRNRHEPKFELRSSLYTLLGADLSEINGFSAYTVLRLLGECGDDMRKWPTAKHFTSWLTLAPGNKISGGKVLSSRTRRSSNRAAVVFRMAAQNVGRTHTALGAFYRRLGAKVGKAKAVTATARKLAVLFYNALRFGMKYVDPGENHYEAKYQERVVHQLKRRAKQMGYTMVRENATVGVS